VGEHWRAAISVLVRCQLFRWMMDLNSDMLCSLTELFLGGCDRPTAADSGDRHYVYLPGTPRLGRNFTIHLIAGA
jgi:hypothetical protein